MTAGKWHGNSHPLCESIHSHPKTKALAKRIMPLMGRAYQSDPSLFQDCQDKVAAQLHRLACWANRESEAGEVGHLHPEDFAAIVRWPRARNVEAFHRAWMESGFIDRVGDSAFIHDWADHMSPRLRDRLRKRKHREREAAV